MSTELVIQPEQTSFTKHQIAALSQIGVQDASPEDLAVFFHQVQRTGLDPFARQIYMLGRRQKDAQGNWVTKQTIQTGIDGFRLIARRAVDQAKETLSISQPYYATPDGKWLDFWPYDKPPVAAKVIVKRNGGEFPAVAMFNEYAGYTKSGELTSMWRSKPAVMIGKCAEALALRKAFPLDLSGLYTSDEMAASNADAAPQVIEAEIEAETPTDDRLPRLWHAMKLAGYEGAKAQTWVSEKLGVEITNPADVTPEDADVLLALLEAEGQVSES